MDFIHLLLIVFLPILLAIIFVGWLETRPRKMVVHG